jgi:hypothetical protein
MNRFSHPFASSGLRGFNEQTFDHASIRQDPLMPGSGAVIEADHVFFFVVIGGTGIDPGHGVLLR